MVNILNYKWQNNAINYEKLSMYFVTKIWLEKWLLEKWLMKFYQGKTHSKTHNKEIKTVLRVIIELVPTKYRKILTLSFQLPNIFASLL